MQAPTFSLDALLAELTRQTPDPEGYYTAAELEAAWGRNRKTVLSLLRRAQVAGKLRCVRVRRPRIDGIDTEVAAYRLVLGREG